MSRGTRGPCCRTRPTGWTAGRSISTIRRRRVPVALLCYAEVVEHTLRELSYQLLPREPSRHLAFFLGQFRATTKRLQEAHNRVLVAEVLAEIALLM